MLQENSLLVTKNDSQQQIYVHIFATTGSYPYSILKGFFGGEVRV